MPNILSSLSFLTDSFKRRKIKNEVLALAQRTLVKPHALLDFAGVDFNNPTPEGLTILLILQDLCKENRQFSIINFKGGVALVRTADVETLNPDYQKVNESSNMIIKGGTDKAANLADNLPTPINDETRNKEG